MQTTTKKNVILQLKNQYYIKVTIVNIVILLFAFCITSCKKRNIIITTEYIINENWGKEWSRPIWVLKMRVKKDSAINPFSDLSQPELMEKLVEDSLFSWGANANTSVNSELIYKTKKIYFSKDNGFIWHHTYLNTDTNIIGNLQANEWYQFIGLIDYPYYVFVYVDSAKQIRRFDVNMANY